MEAVLQVILTFEYYIFKSLAIYLGGQWVKWYFVQTIDKLVNETRYRASGGAVMFAVYQLEKDNALAMDHGRAKYKLFEVYKWTGILCCLISLYICNFYSWYFP